jgi:hypothetical protein
MEVHHHSHTADHDIHQGKKKWSHYFWEFLMLFLAVTLGFFVENKREHIVENKRARQYASFLYDDLVKDTSSLLEGIDFMATGIKKLDTLILVLKSFDPAISVPRVYALSGYAYSNPIFNPTMSTIEQLKNSGSLRYFHDKNLIQIFSKYDNDILILKTIEDRNAYLSEEMRKFLAQFLDLKKVNLPVVTDSARFTMHAFTVDINLKLYKNDPSQFEQFANLCTLKQIDWSNRLARQSRILISMRNLTRSLKDEYHLE